METDRLSAGWQATTLAAIARPDGRGFVDGPFGSDLPASEYTPTGIPVIRGGNLSLGDTRFRGDEFVFVSEKTASRLARSFCQAGDIIFTKKGTLGQIGLVPNTHRYSQFLLSSNQMKLSVDRNIADSLFIYYYLASPDSRTKIIRDSEATGVPKTNLTYLRTFPVLLPPLFEQQAIAHILGTLDDKIELNRRMNETLEAIARALFKSWFVDFDPVRAKAQGRQPAGMDAETAALFPDGFEESPLGEIPSGWQVTSIGEVVCYLNRGIQPTYVDEGGVVVINQKCIRDHRINMADARRHDENKRSIEGRELRIGDVLVNSTGVGTLGRVAQVVHLQESAIVDTHVTVVRADPNTISWNVLGLELMGRESEIDALGEGSTGQTELNRERLKSLPIMVPPLSIQQAFDQRTLSLRHLISANEQGALTLAAIRDALLPKLLSGEIRVKEAEKLVEAKL